LRRGGALSVARRGGGRGRGRHAGIGGGVGVTREAILAARTAAWAEDARAVLAALVAELRPSAHHLTDILDWLDDIAARDGAPPESIMNDASLRAIARGGSSAPERLKRW